jgi:hypothetical protein
MPIFNTMSKFNVLTPTQTVSPKIVDSINVNVVEETKTELEKIVSKVYSLDTITQAQYSNLSTQNKIEYIRERVLAYNSMHPETQINSLGKYFAFVEDNSLFWMKNPQSSSYAKFSTYWFFGKQRGQNVQPAPQKEVITVKEETSMLDVMKFLRDRGVSISKLKSLDMNFQSDKEELVYLRMLLAG